MTQRPGWLDTVTGRDLLREEIRQVRQALEGVFGDQFLQIGGWGDPGLFKRLARTRRSVVVTAVPGKGVDIVSAPDALSVSGDCIDAILLPHTLELADDPHAVLREVDRVLRPDGSLVVLGFNPWGWWGLRHALTRPGFPPGTQRLVSEGRLHDWLRLLDFKVNSASFYFFVPPILRRVRAKHRDIDGSHRGRTPGQGKVREQLMGRLGVVRRVPVLAGCYIVVARKETFAVTPIRPVWRRRPALVTGLVNPTTRNAA